MAWKAPPDHVRTLDGWRAVAILLVMANHVGASVREVLPERLRPVLNEQVLINLGFLGVHVFFGISGFLITRRLVDETRRNGRISLRAFYLRRAFRILPAAWLFLSVMGVLAIARVLPISRAHWLAALLGYANYTYGERSWYLGHFWSLAVEEHFYLLWPTLLALFGLRKGSYACALLLLAVPSGGCSTSAFNSSRPRADSSGDAPTSTPTSWRPVASRRCCWSMSGSASSPAGT